MTGIGATILFVWRLLWYRESPAAVAVAVDIAVAVEMTTVTTKSSVSKNTEIRLTELRISENDCMVLYEK